MKTLPNKLIFIVLYFCAVTCTYAQVSQTGTPKSFGLTLDTLKAFEMPTVDKISLLKEDEKNDLSKEIPWRFGFNIPVSLGSESHGEWEDMADGSRIWRIRLHSSNAYHINLLFDQYKLPLGAQLFVYNKSKKQILGAFTSENNQDDGQFATTLLVGDDITIEYNEPANVAFEGQLHLSRVTHGYRDAFSKARAFGSSGSCNVNVNCPDGAPWSCAKKSVAIMVVGGSGFCTGSLVNNGNLDKTPYILTADHCYSTDVGSWVAWFNWESADCLNPATSPTFNAASGMTLISRNGASDYCLVKLNAAIPAAYDVTYAGWDRSGIVPSGGIGIHHPAGDIKKISFDDDLLTSTQYGSSITNGTWNADWDRAGITEPGSSGSALFDTNKRIVGQLFGGPSACGVSIANKNDYYGKFSVSWNYGTTTTERCKESLDPLSGNISFIDTYGCGGFNLSAGAGSPSICPGSSGNYTIRSNGFGYTGAIALSVSGLPSGITASLGSSSISAGATSGLSVNVGSSTAAGSYFIVVTGTGGGFTSAVGLEVVVANGSNTLITLIQPAAFATGAAKQPALSWTAIIGVTYDVAIANDASFSSIVASANGITASSYSPPTALNAGTVYYWRVRAISPCLTGAYVSSVFQTGYCGLYTSTDVPKLISSSGTVTINSVLNVANVGVTSDLNIQGVVGTHTYMSDLIFRLISPTGTTVTFVDKVCDSNDDFSFSFDDAINTLPLTGTACAPAPVGHGLTWTPGQPLSVFNNTNANGTWTMQISDTDNADGGALNGWGIVLCPLVSIPEYIPNTVSTVTADAEITDGTGWTHYYKRAFTAPQTTTDLLLLSVKKDATVVITPSQVSVGVVTQSAGVSTPSAAAAFVANPTTWKEINRYWNVTPTTQPSAAGVDVRFYYTTAEYNALRAAVPGISSFADLKFVKFGAGVDPNPQNGHLGATQNNTAFPTSTHQAYATDHYGEFHVDGFSGGTIGGGSTILPVRLVRFDAEKKASINSLTWVVTAEQNIAQYEVERSVDGQNFDKIGTVLATAENINTSKTYHFGDRQPNTYANYYRLKILEKDGRFDYSSAIFVGGKVSKSYLTPNPNDGSFVVYFDKNRIEHKQIEVLDMNGRQILNLDIDESQTEFAINKELPSGIYTLKIKYSDELETLKFVVR